MNPYKYDLFLKLGFLEGDGWAWTTWSYCSRLDHSQSIFKNHCLWANCCWDTIEHSLMGFSCDVFIHVCSGVRWNRVGLPWSCDCYGGNLPCVSSYCSQLWRTLQLVCKSDGSTCKPEAEREVHAEGVSQHIDSFSRAKVMSITFSIKLAV